MRPYVTKIIAILVLIGAIYGAKKIAGSKKKNKPNSTISIPTAFVKPAQNQAVPVVIVESGMLTARYRIDLYAEVQGVMESSAKEFKAGSRYAKGELLVKIKSDDYYANLQAQKSALQNLITSIIPDIKLDFPEAFGKWESYLKAFDINKPIPPLPEPGSEKEKFFLTGKNIYTSYYNTKNLEVIYSKYQLTAPYDGILTEALVTPGSLVRNGQKLGEFINPGEYELELALSENLAANIEVGKEVIVYDTENPDDSWTGTVSRMNGKVDPTTQTIQLFVSLKGEGLKEGMYLEAHINGKEKMNALEIPRNLLKDDSKIYTVSPDSVLVLEEIQVAHKTRKNVIIQGVEDNTWVLSKAIPGAYDGMKVAVKQQ